MTEEGGGVYDRVSHMEKSGNQSVNGLHFLFCLGAARPAEDGDAGAVFCVGEEGAIEIGMARLAPEAAGKSASAGSLNRWKAQRESHSMCTKVYTATPFPDRRIL